MAGVGIVRYLLANNSGLITVVPAARIYAGDVPLKTALPAISVRQISGVPRNTVSMAHTTIYVQDRVQVTVYTKTYPLQKSTLELVRDALPVTHGTVNGFVCEAILPDNEGPDFYDDIDLIYEQSQDFMVAYRR